MSLPASNNLPIMPSTSGSSSITTGPNLQQQQQQQHLQRVSHEQQGSGSSRNRQCGQSSKGARAANRNLRQPTPMNSTNDAVLFASSDHETSRLNKSESSQVSAPQACDDRYESGDASKTTANRPKGHRFAKPGSGAAGKYKQRQQLNQLIDGMDGLDIDLMETIAPTSSGSKTNEVGKGRHATFNRKVNLTHLLNHDRRQRGNRRRYEGNQNSAEYHSKTYYRDFNPVHKFSKQQFLQANCQFVVLPFHDYTVHKVDPDWPVNWDCIEEVKFRQTGTTETTCPICLDPPIAAKITKCGHIYCWTCMLHYLSLSDEKDRQCPICFEPISETDLRSVVSRLYDNHSVDEEIVMRLMFRLKGCVEVEPYEGAGQMDRLIQASGDRRYSSQANLLIVDPSTVISEVTKREHEELLVKLGLDRDEPEVCFVEQALAKLSQRIEKLKKMPSYSPATAIDNKECEQTTKLTAAQRVEKSFLFYQSSDGQHIYLNPFSTKILCYEYESLDRCPIEIRAQVLQMDWISMSESWRKRFKYLEHLPLTCEFRLIEIDFEKSNLVSKDTYNAFANQIRMRANERTFRKTEELERDKIIQIEQNRKIYGIQPSLEINLDNEEQFPSVFEEGRSSQLRPVMSPEPTDDIAPSLEPVIPDSSEQLQLPEQVEGTSTKLSFREIQETQMASEAIKGSSSKGNATSAWRAPKGRPTGSQQSSFAKLLVDAKLNPKQWTRNSEQSAPKSSFALPGPSQPRQRITSMTLSEPETEQEQRAHPSTFTISDYLGEKRLGRKLGKKN